MTLRHILDQLNDIPEHLFEDTPLIEIQQQILTECDNPYPTEYQLWTTIQRILEDHQMTPAN